MFFQSYSNPAMSGGLFGRGADAMMVNDPSTNPIMNNKAFEQALKFAYQGYKLDKANPSMNRTSFFQQYGNLTNPGQARNQIDGGLFNFAQNNFNSDLFGDRRRQKNFGFSQRKFGDVGNLDQYLLATNNRWR